MAAYTIGPHSLQAVCRTLTNRRARQWAVALGNAMHRVGITESHACAHFIGQCAHESGEFRLLREIWGPTRAQRGYWCRRDLQGPGRLWPGLGYVCRGAGLIQTTGRVNMRRAAKVLGISYPRLLVVCGTKKYAALLAAVWWADAMPHDMHDWTVEKVTRHVNGGTTGLRSRELYTARAMKVRKYLNPEQGGAR